jgi:hypothetical protein
MRINRKSVSILLMAVVMGVGWQSALVAKYLSTKVTKYHSMKNAKVLNHAITMPSGSFAGKSSSRWHFVTQVLCN